MSSAFENMKTRRSTRKYKQDMIPAEVLDEIIEAGLYAPSGRNMQSPIVVAVRNKHMRDRLSRLNAAVAGMDGDPFYGAPVVLIVLANRACPTYVYDGSLTMGNLMLAAHEKGVASCWIHRAKEVFDSEEGKAILKELGIEGDYEGIGNCILGYAESDIPAPPERKDGRAFYID